METSNWKKVSITDLFEVECGIALTKSNWGEPIYNYIGSSSVNNGVTGKCNQWNYENILSINYDGSVGFSFWHPYKLFLSDRCRALIPKFKPTNNTCIFIATVITKSLTVKYNYGKKLNTKRLSKESIYLPYKNDEINWEWIEDFMEKCKMKIPKLPKIKDGKNMNLDTSTWKSFNITDLFDIKGCSGNIKKLGDYPQISASEFNNGVSGKSTEWKHENCFTISKDGRPGIMFWHPYKFDVNCHVNVLIPKFKVTDNIGVFISAVTTKKLVPNYNYGKALGQSRLSKESIFLPSKNNEPDWEYMENFMNNLIEK